MADDPEPRRLQLCKEAFVIESVLLRVLQDAAPEWVRDEVAEDFFCVEAPAGTEDPVRLPDRGSPRRHVMNDRKASHLLWSVYVLEKREGAWKITMLDWSIAKLKT